MGRAKGKVEQLVSFGYVKEAELGDVGGFEEASEEFVQRAVGRVVDWCGEWLLVGVSVRTRHRTEWRLLRLPRR